MGHLLNMALKMASTPSTRLRVSMLDQTGYPGYVEVYRNDILIDTIIPEILDVFIAKDYPLNNGDTFYVKVYGDEYHGFDYFSNGTYVTSSYAFGIGSVTSSTYTASTNGLYDFSCVNIYL